MTAKFAAIFLLLVASVAWAQNTIVAQGDHDFSPTGPSPVKGNFTNTCLYCHAPHGAASASLPLWNQTLTVQTYTTYTSSTYDQQGLQPLVGSPSKLCLSCHDGSVAPGHTIAYGTIAMTGTMRTTSVFGGDLRSSHPFSMQTPLVNNHEINTLLFGTPPQTADPKVQLINGTVECTTCHEPHFQGLDPVVPMFLARDSSSGKLCLACHDPTRVVAGTTNYLGGWAASAHATAANTTSNSPYVGGYGNVGQNACESCHMPHNATGPARLLRGSNEAACLGCHSGTNTVPALLNVASEFAKARVHPYPAGLSTHDRAEPAVLNNNRHATCADCHNPHGAQPTATFGNPPGVRPSQTSAVGVSATDGVTVVSPAVNQYEVCFRCHGTSAGKVADPTRYGYLPLRVVAAGDPLNIILQLASTNTSSHPVTHTRSSANPQPSLMTNMLKLDGVTQGRLIGTQIFCTDCHNADDNRESGGTGPNGPHGSTFPHILERRYEIAQAPSPGALITNLYPNPDLSVNGPFALCGKCHDLSNVLSDRSFPRHSKHVQEFGVPCSGCHTPHGMGTTSAYVTGECLVNFDANVVAPLGTTPITFNRAAQTCTLLCHGIQHNQQHY